ncbi:MAG: zf-HC2 domain-containing protein [Acidobacteria bacterium]|nr:zf-HC2 domain-containing protein [Acidobacteriota bacterium]
MSKMTCRACSDFLADYLDGQLDPGIRATFEVHLDKCRNCRAYLEQYAAVIKAGRCACERENEQAAGALPEELVRAILAAQAERGNTSDA